MLYTLIKDIFYKNQFSDTSAPLDRDRYFLGLMLLTLLPTLLAYLEQVYIAPWPTAYWLLSTLGDDLGMYLQQMMEASLYSHNNHMPLTTTVSPLLLILQLHLAIRAFGHWKGIFLGLFNCYVCFGHLAIMLAFAHGAPLMAKTDMLLMIRLISLFWGLFHLGVYWRKDCLAAQQPCHPLLFTGDGPAKLSPIKFLHAWVILGIAFWLASSWLLLAFQQTNLPYEQAKLAKINLALALCSTLLTLYLITQRMRNMGWRWGRWLTGMIILPIVGKIIAQLFEGLWGVIPSFSQQSMEWYPLFQVPLTWISQQILPIASFLYLLLTLVLFVKPAAGYQLAPASEKPPQQEHNTDPY